MIYANAGAVTTLSGTFFWTATFLFWVSGSPWWWVLTLTLVLALSSFTFAMAFSKQNYQILGWMWVPTTIFFLENGLYVQATLTALGMSLFALTPVILLTPLIVVYSLNEWSLAPLIAVSPGIAVVIAKYLGVGSGVFSWRERLEISKLIGFTRSSVKYKRTSMRLDKILILVGVIFSISISLIWLASGTPPLLLLTALGLTITNQILIRFADHQSMWMLLATTLMIDSMRSPSWLVLIGVWLALNFPPRLLALPTVSKGKFACDVKALAPIDVRPALSQIDAFLSPLPPRSRVLMAFRDPGGVYENLFDGFRNAIEILIYAANRRDILLVPQWWTIEEINSPESPGIWIDTPEDIRPQTEFWNCDAILILRTDSEHLSHDDLVSLSLERVNAMHWTSLTGLMPESSSSSDWGGLELELWKAPAVRTHT